MMEKVIKLLKENPVHIATADQNGRPKVRPFMLLLEKDGRLYFSTSPETSAFEHLSNNPNIAVSAVSPDFVWVKITAKAVFTDDMSIRELAFKDNQKVQELFGTANNPDFKVFYLTEGKCTLCDHSGAPHETFSF